MKNIKDKINSVNNTLLSKIRIRIYIKFLNKFVPAFAVRHKVRIN